MYWVPTNDDIRISQISATDISGENSQEKVPMHTSSLFELTMSVIGHLIINAVIEGQSSCWHTS